MPIDTDFLFRRSLSLKPLIDFWRGVAEDPTAPLAPLAPSILEAVDAAPELLAPIEDFSLLEPHQGLIERMMIAVFPAGLSKEVYAAAFPPFMMMPIHATSRFYRLIEHAEKHEDMNEQVETRKKIMRAYHHLLDTYYGVKLHFDVPMLFPTKGKTTGLSRYFRFNVDFTFCDPALHGDLPQLSDEDLSELQSDPMNLDLWTEKLPPDLFELQGMVILSAVDVTDQEVLSLLKHDLLQKDAMASAERLDKLQDRLRTLLRCPDLQVGLLHLERVDPEAIPTARPVGRSLLFGTQNAAPACTHGHVSSYGHVVKKMEPIVISDLEQAPYETGFEYYLREQGFRSVMLAPLTQDQEIIGVLEIASPAAGALNSLNVLKLDEVISLFTTALRRSLDERENRLQAVIKQQYTAVHPTVEWRFREAAASFVQQQIDGVRPTLESIVFRDVFPLYGLTDVRNSSVHRNAAIQADLLEQVGLALAVVMEAKLHRPLPVLDELAYQMEHFVEELQGELSSEHELTVLDFLRNDVEPLFDHLADFGTSVQERIDAYRASIDAEVGILYRRRRDFDATIQRINDTVGMVLDMRQEQAQAMFPHYFEKYKTDGVDYNLYVGASLVDDKPFDMLYLRNLRLWQLLSTCAIDWALEKLMPELKIPLRTAHLILVQHLPLSIRFRQEEKHFDVDGAYNIRYEIIKKRIDKARVLGTGERLTQPGHIAIVYSQQREIAEYHRYLDFLRASGYLTGDAEELELEDLQGVHGLKALRIAIAPPPPEMGDGQAVDTALPEIEATPAETAA